MKENIKAMLMYSKAPSMMKTKGRDKIMFCRKLTLLPRTTKTNLEDISHKMASHNSIPKLFP
jgi:hypothetical protein